MSGSKYLDLERVLMAKKVFIVSDLTGELVPDEEHVSVMVLDHPTLQGTVRLDASESEIKSLESTAANFVVVEVLRQSGTERLIVELDKFDALFKGDPQEALAGAESLPDESRPRRGRPRGSSARAAAAKPAKRDPDQLNAIRAWARSNGYEVSDRGRIKAEIEEAYSAANV
jgi:hypothetical protein